MVDSMQPLPVNSGNMHHRFSGGSNHGGYNRGGYGQSQYGGNHHHHNRSSHMPIPDLYYVDYNQPLSNFELHSKWFLD